MRARPHGAGQGGNRLCQHKLPNTNSYDFYIVIHVNNPYFNEIRFKLNNSKVDNDEETLLDSPTAMPRSRSGVSRPTPGAARPGAVRPSAVPPGGRPMPGRAPHGRRNDGRCAGVQRR